MRLRILLLCCFLGLTFLNPVLSQTSGRSFLRNFFSPDSLRGFDEEAFSKAALAEGLYGEEFKRAVYLAKKNYIINKYYPNAYDITNFKINSSANVLNAPCVNEGFEAGNFTGWVTTQGTNSNSCSYPNASTPLTASPPLLTIINTPFFDANAGITIPNSPLGGSKVAKINNNSAGFKVIKLTQNFSVTNANYLYDFVYYAVQNGVHGCCDQPYMFVRLRDCIGNLLACPVFSFNAPATNSAICPGTGPATWSNAPVGGGVQVSKGWQKYSIDLTQYINTCVTVEVIVGDCSFGGHYLYSYFDSNCNTMNVSVNGTLTSMPTTTVNVSAPCATTATLTAPSGLSPYSWNGPPGSGITTNTNQTISTAVAGNYTLTMTPPGICNPIFRIINLQFAPPATITASPSNTICLGNSATLTASGALNYTWSPGGSTAASIVVSPTATSIYTLTAKSGTCIGTFTTQINVTSSPTVTISASSNSVCASGPTTLTASGATSYTWSTGATGSTIVVTPTASTTYTVIGLTGSACTATSSINIGVVPTPTNVVAVASPSYICPGATSNLFGSAVGATSYSWFPGPLLGSFVSVNPLTTTVYTLLVANGSCTNSAQVTVSVNPGPTLTPVASPTAICPGGSSTLSATGAISYTWNPGSTISSSIVASPTITSTYSVTGIDALGCTKTSTLSLVVSPVPNVTISPASPSICVGTSATLTASGASTYTWNPGGTTGTSIVVSPTANTTYTLIGSNGTCTNSATKIVTVVPIPTVSASSSTTSICSGSSLTLTGSGATTYTWNPGNLVGTNVTVSPTITTTYTVVGSSGTCTSSAVVSVTVNNGPVMTANASPTAVCPGNSSTLTATGALSYTWNPGALSGASVVVTPASTTTYSVIGNNAFGCVTTKTVSLVVSPIPTINPASSSSSICIGSSATLTATGASTYTWNPGALTGSNVTVSPASNTTYTVVGSNGTCTNSATIGLTVVPIPTVSASSSTTSICAGSSLTLTASGATTYTWNPGNLIGTNVTVSPTITTTYTVIGTSGTCTSSAVVSVTVNNGPTLTVTASPSVVCAGNSSTLTASGAVSYTWNPGSITGSTANVTPASTTIYSVTGSTALGCVSTKTTAVTVNPNPTVTPAASSPSICIGNSATLTASGATTYTWNPGALTGSNISVSPTISTTYTVTGTNGFGCTSQNTISINVVPVPTVSAISNPTSICNGSSATLTAAGASTYTWNPGSLTGTSVVVSPTINTTYTVIGNNGSCSSTSTIALVVNPTPTLIANPTPTSICVSGNVTLTASGAATYSWMPGTLTGSSVVVSPTVTTNYTVTGASAFGCTNIATTTVVVNTVPVLTLAATPTAICNGATSTLTALGATTYTWLPGSLTGSNVSVSPTVTTTYSVTGATGACSTTQTITLIVNPNPTVTASASPTNICAGSSSTLTANGAASYTWNPGSLNGSTVAVTPTATTIYTVTGSTALGCVNITTVNLLVTPLPTITAVANPTAICTGNSSTLTANGAGSYTWNPGALTGSNIVVSPTVSTTYTINGTSGICSNTQTLNLVVNPLPTLTATASSPTICTGQSTSLTASGAATYTWNPGTLTGSTVVVSPTINTTYTVTGTSSFGCINTGTVSVTVNPLPTLSVTASATNICAGTSATLTGSGGVSYFWNPGGVPGNPIVVSPTTTTTYTLFGTSGSGCVNTLPFTLSVTPVPTITAVSNPTAICIGNSSTLTANGANSYTWNPGALTGSNVVVTPTINTTYTISGATGICSSTQTVSVAVNSLPTLTATANAATVCAGVSSTLSGSGAVTYTWNPGALTGSNAVVAPTITTTYTLAGTNASGCTNTKTVTVTVNPLPTLTISSTATAVCAGSSATLTGSGGASFTWSPGGSIASTLIVSPAITSTYTLAGSSAAGCTNTALFTLSVIPVTTITAVSSPTAVCLGNSSTLTASGATNYTWNPGALTGSNVVVTPTTTITYTVTGANGICNNTQTVSIIVNPVPSITATANSATICTGGNSTLVASGGTTYNWTPGALSGNSVVVSPTITTTYTVTGNNAFGCTGTKTVIVNVNPLPTLSITTTATTLCSGASATLTGSGASSYTWMPGGANTTTLAITPTLNTTYTLSGTSAAGCSNTQTITINSNTTPTVTVSATNTVLCAGGSSTLTANGATTYSWNPGALTGNSVTVTPATSTIYTVTGANGACTATAAITVSVNSIPTITVVSNPTVLCSGNTATLSASGAASFTWMPLAAVSPSVIDNPTSTAVYTVTGAAANGCTAAIQYTLNVTPTPTVIASASASAICAGSSSTLTASGASSYTWNPGALTGTNIIVTPSVTTTYTLTGITGNCSNTSLITITVNALPTITANASPSVVCAGSSSTLTASGASTFTWSPSGTTGSTITVSPALTTTYTVIGTNTNGCSNSSAVTVSVNATPTVIAAVSPTSICAGATGTLIASGATTFTWNPGSLTSGVVTVTPSSTTVYTVTGSDAIGCSSTKTVQLLVYTTPTVTASASATSICSGSSASLTAAGAASYTWQPGLSTGTMIVVTPTATSVYTLTGSNGNCGTGSTTISVVVNSAPTITASVSGTITCTTPSVDLSGSSSATNVAYTWNGPGGFTTSVQSPTGIAIPGSYTLTVNDVSTGCSSTATVGIVTDTTVPTLTATASGTVTCANPSATVIASSSSTNASYNWSGPLSFTNTSQSFTTSIGGTYTITITDLGSNCAASTVVVVNTDTAVPITATILPATCSGTMANNDGTIMTSGFGATDKYDLVAGSTYTGTSTYATATVIPLSGIITNTLANPALITPYTIRFFAANGCTKDTTLFLLPTSCITNTVFGIAKAVSTATVQSNGTYNATYSVMVTNTGSQPLNNIALDENLALTFPSPTTFSIISNPVVTSQNSSISINSAFDGSVQTIMTNTATSILAPGKTDTIVFTVNIKHNGNFGPFDNTVLGWASPTTGVVFGDSSNTGYNPDPDLDGDPTNNNVPTVLNLTPNLFFGLTKAGTLGDKLDDNTYDITYTITVHNLGNDTLKNIIVKDSLFNNTIKQPASYTIKSGPIATGSLVANNNYNGNTDINLLNASQSLLAPGSVNSIVFTINVNPDTVTIIKNSAFGYAVNTTSILVSDTSNAGTNPDTNSNGVWNEAADNVPTLLTIPNTSLFIPQGFSPDADGKNDQFVIKGLQGTENTLTIYNRWGNKVYSKNNYDNSWGGYPNVTGTLGNEKLPQGTYYYILEIKSGETKTMNGFIVIQY